MLTLKQKGVLDAIAVLRKEKGYTPTYREIADALSLKSLATVHKHLHVLAAKGFVATTNRSRSIKVLYSDVNAMERALAKKEKVA